MKKGDGIYDLATLAGQWRAKTAGGRAYSGPRYSARLIFRPRLEDGNERESGDSRRVEGRA